MKKGTIITTCIALAGIAVIGGIWWFNHNKGEDETQNQQTAVESAIDFATLLSSNGTEQAIRLPNSEEMVYIEGISKEEADSLDNALRVYEEAAGTEIDTTNELAYLFTEIGPAIEAWFDPSVDTVAEFKAVEHDSIEAWLFTQLEIALEREDCVDAFYYRERESGGYVMSYGYYLVGYAHSGLWKLAQKAE